MNGPETSTMESVDLQQLRLRIDETDNSGLSRDYHNPSERGTDPGLREKTSNFRVDIHPSVPVVNESSVWFYNILGTPSILLLGGLLEIQDQGTWTLYSTLYRSPLLPASFLIHRLVDWNTNPLIKPNDFVQITLTIPGNSTLSLRLLLQFYSLSKLLRGGDRNFYPFPWCFSTFFVSF